MRLVIFLNVMGIRISGISGISVLFEFKLFHNDVPARKRCRDNFWEGTRRFCGHCQRKIESTSLGLVFRGRAYLSRGGVGGELLHARLPQRGAPASEHSHFFLHADDEKRELVLAVRGTSRVLDCVMDASMRPVKWSDGMYTHGWAAAHALHTCTSAR